MPAGQAPPLAIGCVNDLDCWHHINAIFLRYSIMCRFDRSNPHLISTTASSSRSNKKYFPAWSVPLKDNVWTAVTGRQFPARQVDISSSIQDYIVRSIRHWNLHSVPAQATSLMTTVKAWSGQVLNLLSVLVLAVLLLPTRSVTRFAAIDGIRVPYSVTVVADSVKVL